MPPLPQFLSAYLGALAAEMPPYMVHEVFAKPIISSDTALKSAQDISSGTVNITTFDLQPDYPRSVRLKFVGTGTAAEGSVTVVTNPLLVATASGTVTYSGSFEAADAFKIRKNSSENWTTWVYNVDFTTDDELNVLINGLDYVNSTILSTAITVTAVAAGAVGNDIEFDQVGDAFTLVQTSGGVDADTITVGPTTYTFVTSGATGAQINRGANQAATATNIAAKFTTDKTTLGLTSATADDVDVDMVVTPVGADGNDKTLTVDGTRITKVQFTGGIDGIVGNVTVAGHNARLEDISEVVAVDTDVTLTYNTAKAFSNVTAVTATLTGCDGSSTLSLGVGTAIGLAGTVPANGVKREALDGVAATTLGTLDATNDTYIPNLTLNGAKALEVWYLSTYQ